MPTNSSPFLRKIAEPLHLSPFAINIHHLMATLSNEALNFAQLAALLSPYPVIPARLLSLANSAWAAPTVPITSLEAACARLGMAVVKSISIAIAVTASFDASRCPQFDMRGFLIDSLLVSDAAFWLARHAKPDSEEFAKTAQTAGILHALGLLWLAENLPVETGRALQQTVQTPVREVNAALLTHTGTDYCQAGAWIGKQWHLPEVLVIAIQYHLDNHYRAVAWEIARLIGAALHLVTAVKSDTPEAWDISLLTDLKISAAHYQQVVTRLVGQHSQVQTLVTNLLA